ncbi:FAD-dependent monooxygenase [Amycolatopsis sp. cg5]|uniref:FAD-dependent monooxygenase n=1 Tax=Amycolatopsis sp. cg5 TaxID=3238802 RepID=UPI0035261564
MPDTDVIVVGAGPTGLLLAAELRLGGAEVVVLERLTEPTTQSRAGAIHARSVEIFDQRGRLEHLGAVDRDDHGHFGGLDLDLGQLPTVHPGRMKLAQARVEAMLTAWVTELGAEIRRGHEVTSVEQTESEVVVNGSLTARYVVGCDGERSSVRELAGFDFPGVDAELELLRADVRGIEVPFRFFQRYPAGLAIALPIDGGLIRLVVHEFGRPPRIRSAPPAFAEVVAAYERVTGEDVSAGEPVWVDAFGNTSRQVTEYRRGRVLLAGDAAHHVMPVGGQAINLGLQDAFNLGWKLAAELRGTAPAGLLDSYHAERHPVGVRVKTNIQAQAQLLLGDTSVDPLREVFRELITHSTVRDHLAAAIAGLDVRYGEGTHPLLGARLPYSPLTTDAGTTDTTSLLRTGRGLLLNLSGEPWTAAGVDVVPAKVEPGSPLSDVDGVLVRPDGHVAWVAGAGSLETAVRRWFG